MENKFPTAFPAYCSGDELLAVTIDGFDIVARIERDDDATPPDKRDDGFWPSLKPLDAGYVGEGVSVGEFERLLEHQKKVLAAWKHDDWCYCGVVLAVSRNGVSLDSHASALWGLDMNYPGGDNSYLTECANELIDDALAEGRKRMGEVCGKDFFTVEISVRGGVAHIDHCPEAVRVTLRDYDNEEA